MAGDEVLPMECDTSGWSLEKVEKERSRVTPLLAAAQDAIGQNPSWTDFHSDISTETTDQPFNPVLASFIDSTLKSVWANGNDDDCVPHNASLSLATAREHNQNFYQRYKNEIAQRYKGMVVVIADGALAGVASDFEDAASLAVSASHRFVFRVGDEMVSGGKMRWPKSRR